MKKIKELLKGSPIAIVIAGLLIAGIASATLLDVYGHTTGTAHVKQSVVFGDGTTQKTYDVGNSDPVAGNVYYDLETLVNNASDKSAEVELQTKYRRYENSAWTDWHDSESEGGITTSYMHWRTPQVALTGVRPTVVYNPYNGEKWSNYKKYEMWYKADENDSYIHYAYYHPSGSTWRWDGADTKVEGGKDCPFVMKEDGKYYMVNYGGDGERHFNIYTSNDGITWSDKGTIYTETEGRDDIEKIDNPMVIKDDSKDEKGYKMYFQGRLNGNDYPDGKYYIFAATSDATNLKDIADGTKKFTAANGGQSILQPGESRSWDEWRIMQPWVTKIGNQSYLMMYTGYDRGGNDDGAISYAISSDGIHNWKTIEVSKEGYDITIGKNAYQPTLVKTDKDLVLFYQNGDKINKTWLTDVSNPMTLQAQEIKPFFIKNDFAINLAPYTYNIKTEVVPVVPAE